MEFALLRAKSLALGVGRPEKVCMPGKIIGPVPRDPALALLAERALELGHEPPAPGQRQVIDLVWPQGDEVGEARAPYCVIG